METPKVRIYTKPGCPYCTKAKNLFDEKAVAYEETDITTFANWRDKLLELTGRQTVPQIFIGQTHVGGYDDLSSLATKGELDALLGVEPPKAVEELYDLVIIGGGPAGMSAAIYAARMKLKLALVTVDLGGQLNLTLGVENYPGYGAANAKDLVADFHRHITIYKIPIFTNEQVTKIGLVENKKRVITASGKEFLARALIIASGRKPRRLQAKREKELIGRGITFCGICDGPLFEGRPVAVVGGGNSGVEESLEMAKFATEVHLITDKIVAQPILVDRLKTEPKIKQYIGYSVTEFVGQEQLEQVKIKKTDEGSILPIHVSGAFIKIGMEPNSSFAVGILKMTDNGEIEVNCSCETGIQGIYAAGDITNGFGNQIVIAAGEGAKAALEISKYLSAQK